MRGTSLTKGAGTRTSGLSPESLHNVRIIPASSAEAIQLEFPWIDPNHGHGIFPCLLARVEGLPAKLLTELQHRAPGMGIRVFPDGEQMQVTKEPDCVLLAGSRDGLNKLTRSFSADSTTESDQGLIHALSSALRHHRTPSSTLLLAERKLSLERPLIMGILNVTPDSFSDGGRFESAAASVDHAHRMLDEGADILDIGGESTRPGAKEVDAKEELGRILPVLSRLIETTNVPISIDTSKAEVAKHAVEAGATLINDVTALGDPSMATTVATHRCGLLLMHMQGTPRSMQASPHYSNLMSEITRFLRVSVLKAVEAGVSPDSIAIDPGFGFGKTDAHNLELLNRLEELTCLGYPVVLGTSRKSTLGHLTGRAPNARMAATAATMAMAVDRGARILRVHDVAAMKDAAVVAHACQGILKKASSPSAASQQQERLR